jgi:hypothetical protein
MGALIVFFSQAIFPYDEYSAIYKARRAPVDSLDCFRRNVAFDPHPAIGDSWTMHVGRHHYLRASHLMGCKIHVDSSLNRFWVSTDTTVIQLNGDGLVRVVGPGRAQIYFDFIAAGGQRRDQNMRLSTSQLTVFSESMTYTLIADQTEISVGSMLDTAEFRINDIWTDTTFAALVTPLTMDCFDPINDHTSKSSAGWRLKQCDTDTVSVQYSHVSGISELRSLRIVK